MPPDEIERRPLSLQVAASLGPRFYLNIYKCKHISETGAQQTTVAASYSKFMCREMSKPEALLKGLEKMDQQAIMEDFSKHSLDIRHPFVAPAVVMESAPPTPPTASTVITTPSTALNVGAVGAYSCCCSWSWSCNDRFQEIPCLNRGCQRPKDGTFCKLFNTKEFHQLHRKPKGATASGCSARRVHKGLLTHALTVRAICFLMNLRELWNFPFTGMKFWRILWKLGLLYQLDELEMQVAEEIKSRNRAEKRLKYALKKRRSLKLLNLSESSAGSSESWKTESGTVDSPGQCGSGGEMKEIRRVTGIKDEGDDDLGGSSSDSANQMVSQEGSWSSVGTAHSWSKEVPVQDEDCSGKDR